MRGRRVVAVTATAGCALGVGATVALAAIPSTDGVIHGCYSNTKGTLRVIDDTAACTTGETRLTWNQKGQPGPQGPQGEQGPAGLPGGKAPGRVIEMVKDMTLAAQGQPGSYKRSSVVVDTSDCSRLTEYYTVAGQTPAQGTAGGIDVALLAMLPGSQPGNPHVGAYAASPERVSGGKYSVVPPASLLQLQNFNDIQLTVSAWLWCEGG